MKKIGEGLHLGYADFIDYSQRWPRHAVRELGNLLLIPATSNNRGYVGFGVPQSARDGLVRVGAGQQKIISTRQRCAKRPRSEAGTLTT